MLSPNDGVYRRVLCWLAAWGVPCRPEGGWSANSNGGWDYVE